MQTRLLWFALTVSAVVSLAAGPVAGQPVPRAADDRPDLQGVWDFRT